MTPDWEWPMVFRIGEAEFVIEGPRQALEFLKEKWPFQKSHPYRMACAQISANVNDRSFDQSAYLAFRIAILTAGVRPGDIR